MRTGIWVPWWLWLLALPLVMAFYVAYALIWLAMTIAAALADNHSRTKALEAAQARQPAMPAAYRWPNIPPGGVR